MAETDQQRAPVGPAAPAGEPPTLGPDLVGREVSCRGLEFFFRKVEEEGGAADTLLDGLSYSRSHLCDGHARIDWASECRLVRNFAHGRTDAELVDIGRELTQSRWIRPFAAVGRLLFTSADLYRWNFDERGGLARRLFTCIHSRVRQIGPDHIEVETSMAPGYAPCRELFLIFRGSLISMPQTLGLKTADVEMTETAAGARFSIRYPTGGGALAWLRKAVMYPWSARTLAREFKQTDDALFARNVALESEISEHRATETALSESDDRFLKAFHATPTPMSVTSLPDGRFIEVNESFVRVCGHPREALIGRRGSDFNMWLEPQQRDAFIARLQAEGTVGGLEAEFETRGGEHWTGLVSGVVVTHSGEPCVVWNALDITERKRAEAAHRDLERRILQAQKLESLGVLAGGIAHDFNNLLVGILGNADLALRETESSPSAKKRIAEIRKAAQRAAELTRQMLAYAGKGQLSRGRLNLPDLIGETARLMRSAMPKNTRFELCPSPDPIWIEADETQIGQVVMNLITNAAESCVAGGGEVRVTTGVVEADRAYLDGSHFDNTLPEGSYAFVEVADTGCGMDEATLKRIFEPFFSTKFTGRGLGLAASLGIVRRHEGALRVTSAPGGGTTFRVLFPLAAAEPAPQPVARAAVEWEGAGRILVVDDEEDVRSVAEEMLRSIGFDPITVPGGTEAIQQLQRHGDSLVAALLDMTMPDMDGETTFSELRRVRADVPIVLSSGHGLEHGSRWADGKTRVAFLAKPYTVDGMRETFRRLLAEGDAAVSPGDGRGQPRAVSA
jgi:PAS domain S-box-containing protein